MPVDGTFSDPAPSATPARGGLASVHAIVALALGALLVDAAIETVLNGSPIRWYVTGLAALSALLTGLLWRRVPKAMAAGAALVAVAITLAICAWLPGGLEHGITALRQPTGVVFAAVTIAAIALAVVTVWRLEILAGTRAVTRAVKIALAVLALYGIVAMALGVASRADYAALLHGASFWQRLPFWAQGAFVGTVLVVALSLLVHLFEGAFKVRGVPLRAWAVKGVLLSVALAIAVAGLRGSPQPLSASSSAPIAGAHRHEEPPRRLQPELDLVVNGLSDRRRSPTSARLGELRPSRAWSA